MEYDIFISYSRKDTAIVDQFVKRLTEAGYRVWIDRDGIYSGDQFKAKIVRAIKDSAIVLFFSSVNSNASDWTVKEISYSLKKSKTIIPVKLDDTEYEDSIDFDLVNIDFINYNTQQISLTLERLMSSVNAHLGKPTIPINSGYSSETPSEQSKSKAISSEQSQFTSSSRNDSKLNNTNKPKATETVETDSDTRFDVVLKFVGARKFSVIQRVKEILSIDLIDAKNLVDYAPTTLIEAAGRFDAETIKKELEIIGATIELKPTPNIDNKGTFKLVLFDSGPQKLQLIKMIKELFTLSLKEAKDLVEKSDTVPVILKESESTIELNVLKESLERISAVTEVVQDNDVQDNESFEILLLGAGNHKASVISAITKHAKLSVQDANGLVKNTYNSPITIKSGTSKLEAFFLKKKLEKAGANILIKRHKHDTPKSTINPLISLAATHGYESNTPLATSSVPTQIDTSLEELYLEGVLHYDKKEYEQAMNNFRLAAEQGYAPAQISLGDCYWDCEGVPEDEHEAVKWYRKAAEQGYDEGQLVLGNCYRDGYGVEEDYHEAVKWMQKAAEQGNELAQFHLGCWFMNGEGVEQNQEEAIKWYLMAAEQGQEDAIIALKQLGKLGKK